MTKIYPKDELFEKLADIEHERWSKWQSYLHSKLTYFEHVINGIEVVGYMLEPEDIERWNRQINTKYTDLTEKEKDSDREQVMRYWDLLN